jgi:hypothetical protein
MDDFFATVASSVVAAGVCAAVPRIFCAVRAAARKKENGLLLSG